MIRLAMAVAGYTFLAPRFCQCPVAKVCPTRGDLAQLRCQQRGENLKPAGLAATAVASCGRRWGHVDLCGTDPGLLDAAAQRHPNDIASWPRCEVHFAIQIVITHEKNIEVRVAPSPLLIPRQ